MFLNEMTTFSSCGLSDKTRNIYWNIETYFEGYLETFPDVFKATKPDIDRLHLWSWRPKQVFLSNLWCFLTLTKWICVPKLNQNINTTNWRQRNIKFQNTRLQKRSAYSGDQLQNSTVTFARCKNLLTDVFSVINSQYFIHLPVYLTGTRHVITSN